MVDIVTKKPRWWARTLTETDIMKSQLIRGISLITANNELLINDLSFHVSIGRRRPRRWFSNEVTNHKDPKNSSNDTAGFDAEIPSEWESWLRHRRDDPPTIHQLIQSQALADIKKVIIK